MTKTNKTLIFLIIVAAIIILFFSWGKDVGNNLGQEEQGRNAGQENVEEQVVEKIKVSLLIEDFNQANLELEIEKDLTVFGVLELVNQEQSELNLKSTTYEGLGVLVEQLGDNVNGEDNKYWQYFVNDEQPMVAADQYVLENGDKVEWRFKESEF